MAISNLSLLEQETIIGWNNAEKTAWCFTHDPVLKRALRQMCAHNPQCCLTREDGTSEEYTFPKRWVKVRAPREMSSEKRSELAERARRNFHHAPDGPKEESPLAKTNRER